MQKIRGFVSHITYQNPENGYTVLTLELSAAREGAEGALRPFSEEASEETLVGNLHGITQGMTIEAAGEYAVHPTYGRQFKVRAFKELPPEGAQAIERYLASGAVAGIGPALARRIVRRFGEDTFRILDEEPERLSEVKGISARKAREIAVRAQEKKELRNAFVFLQEYGIGNTLAVKIYKLYGDEIYDVIKSNPYRLAEDVEGVGFRTADEIAARAGIAADSGFRVRSGMLYTLSEASAQGHLYLPRRELFVKAAALLRLPEEREADEGGAAEDGTYGTMLSRAQQELMDNELANLSMDRKVVVRGEAVYTAAAYYAELQCARKLLDLRDAVSPTAEEKTRENGHLTSFFDRLSESEGLSLDEGQREAVRRSLENGVFLLSGGPGTGKTTTLNAMLRCLEARGEEFLLAAPTGRAAKRMTEATGYEAKTIHRLLEVNGNPEGGASAAGEREAFFARDGDNPLEADVVVIDETSMVDIYLMQALLKAISPGTRLVLVGDVDQLPSVGPGQVLKDILESGRFPQVKLNKIHRQRESSRIVDNAHRINRGEMPVLDNQSEDFFFLQRDRAEVIYKHIVQLIREKLPRYVRASEAEIQVLTPMKKGALGAVRLNEILQETLNPGRADRAEYDGGETLFRVGDKVMQVKNNYRLAWRIEGLHHIKIDEGEGVFNGDMGKIVDISEAEELLTVEFDEGRLVDYPFADLSELELAYAVTIHKSQGSEYPAVILPLLSGPARLFNRNLLYTAVTRAKSCVVILGSRGEIEAMVKNAGEQRRYTGLRERIEEIAGEEN